MPYVETHLERFNDAAKRALELALREALVCGDNYIGPQHLLAGLTRLHRDGDWDFTRPAVTTSPRS